MKRIILLISLIFGLFVLNSQAQSTTRAAKKMAVNDTYYLYTGTAADTLCENRDTLKFPIEVNTSYPIQFYIDALLTKRVGNDTTVKMNIYGKVFDYQDYTLISSATSAVVVTNTDVNVSNVASQVYTILLDTTKYNATIQEYYTGTSTCSTIASYYRYLLVEFVIAGNDSVGTGVKVTKFAVKLWERKF